MISRALFSLLLASAVAVAQTVTDIPIPPTVGALVGSTFVDAETVAAAELSGNGLLHIWSGLPSSPALTTLSLPANLRMMTPLLALGEGRGVYGAPGGLVAVVVGLPRNPQVILTNVVALASPLVLLDVNPTTIVRVTSTGFLVIRHDAVSYTTTFISAPENIVTGASVQPASISSDSVCALGVGPDGFPLTADDCIVRLSGLSAPTLSSLSATSVPRTQSWAPEGCIVVPDSAAVVWRRSSFGLFDLEILSENGPNLDSALLNVSVPGPFGYSMFPDYGVGFGVVPPHGLCISHQDDVGLGHVLLARLQGTPLITNAWFDDPVNAYTSSTILNDRDVAFLSFVPPTGFSYTRWFRGAQEYGSTFEPDNFDRVSFLAPNSRVLAAFAHVYDPINIGQLNATLTLKHQGTNVPPEVTFTKTAEQWVGVNSSSVSALRIFTMSPGRIGGFLRTGGLADRPNSLRLLSFPAAGTSERLGAEDSVSGMLIDVTPEVPSIASATTLTVSLATPNPSAAFLGISLGLAAPFRLVPGDATIHLDLAQSLPLIPLNFSGTAASVTFAGGLPPSLIGLPIYVQAAASLGSQVVASDVAVIVF